MSTAPQASQDASVRGMRRVPSIAIVRQRYSPFGGGEEIIRQAAELLSSDGQVDVSIVAREWNGEQSEEVKFVRCNPPYWGRFLRELTFCLRASSLARNHFDILQSHERVPGAHVYRAGDGVYRNWVRNYLRVMPPWRRWVARCSPFHLLLLTLERRMYHAPELRAVIANSQMVADEIAQEFPHVKGRVHVIWNGVDCSRFSPELRGRHRHEVLGRHGLRENQRVAVFLGSGWIRKGLITAIYALGAMPDDVRLLVVGHDKRRGQFERVVRQLGLGDRVVFAGPRRDPEAYLGCADALVLPSLYDAMPNSVLEAMAVGIPVVVSSHTGAAHLVKLGHCGEVCDPFERDEWGPALERALDQDARQRWGDAARAVALQHTMERMASEWLALYRTLIDIGGRR